MAERGKCFGSFKEFFENSGVEFEASVEKVSRQDENIANNRLFVWNFESSDLKEMVDLFEIYKRDIPNESTRQKLNSSLLRKMNSMIREGYNPAECMLYASKTINQKLSNDKPLQDILAERIRDVYLKSSIETSNILKNIIEMWTWIPQLKVVITAIGLIGENEELLDLVSVYYGEDENLKDRAFHAFMQNKSMSNLERALKIVTSLQDTENDQIMGRRFAKEVNGFGWEGIKVVEKYNDNPAVSKTGKNVIRRILRDNGNIIDEKDDDGVYRETLATKSLKDDLAYKDFMEDCYEKHDRRAAFLCRFSRADAGHFLKELLENPDQYDSAIINDAIISMAMLGKKGYSPSAAIIRNSYKEESDNYAPLVAEIILGEQSAINKLVCVLCEKGNHELGRLYGVLKSSSLKYYTESISELHRVLFSKFVELLDDQDYFSLDVLVSNLEMLWDKKLYYMIPMDMLKYMQKVLKAYSNGEYDNMPETIIISMMNTIVYSWNETVENVIFCLYHNANNSHIQQLSYKILQSREVQAPK